MINKPRAVPSAGFNMWAVLVSFCLVWIENNQSGTTEPPGSTLLGITSSEKYSLFPSCRCLRACWPGQHWRLPFYQPHTYSVRGRWNMMLCHVILQDLFYQAASASDGWFDVNVSLLLSFSRAIGKYFYEWTQFYLCIKPYNQLTYQWFQLYSMSIYVYIYIYLQDHRPLMLDLLVTTVKCSYFLFSYVSVQSCGFL